MTITKYIKSHDDYGHNVNLNFNGNGETVNTLVGGTLSILLTWVFRIYMFLRIKTLVTLDNTNVLTVTYSTNYDELS